MRQRCAAAGGMQGFFVLSCAVRNPAFHALLTAFKRRTGCPVLVNTSFNVRGEPIVCTPREAYVCFMRTGIDYLVIEDHVLDKRSQPSWPEGDAWRSAIAPD